MKTIKCTLLIIVLNIIFPISIYADCESDFKAVEKDFKVSYKYNEDTDDFTIKLVCPDRNKYTFGFYNPDDVKDAYWTNEEEKKITTINNYKKDEYKYMLLGTYGDCKDYIVKEGTIKLTKDNPYINNSLCEGNEDFSLCQKENKEIVDEDTFKIELEGYKQNKSSKKSNKIATYFNKNKTEIIIITLLIISFIVGFIIYNRK